MKKHLNVRIHNLSISRAARQSPLLHPAVKFHSPAPATNEQLELRLSSQVLPTSSRTHKMNTNTFYSDVHSQHLCSKGASQGTQEGSFIPLFCIPTEQVHLHQCPSHRVRTNRAASCDLALPKSVKQRLLHVKKAHPHTALLQC